MWPARKSTDAQEGVPLILLLEQRSSKLDPRDNLLN